MMLAIKNGLIIKKWTKCVSDEWITIGEYMSEWVCQNISISDP